MTTRQPYVYVDSPVVTGPRFIKAVILVTLAAALLDAEAQADGCAYAEDWVACVEAQREAAKGRMADLERRADREAAERSRARQAAEERDERERREDDAAARGRCQFGGC